MRMMMINCHWYFCDDLCACDVTSHCFFCVSFFVICDHLTWPLRSILALGSELLKLVAFVRSDRSLGQNPWAKPSDVHFVFFRSFQNGSGSRPTCCRGRQAERPKQEQSDMNDDEMLGFSMLGFIDLTLYFFCPENSSRIFSHICLVPTTFWSKREPRTQPSLQRHKGSCGNSCCVFDLAHPIVHG